MSPENTHTLMEFYMEVLILGVIFLYMVSALFKLFPIGCIGLIYTSFADINNCLETSHYPTMRYHTIILFTVRELF